MQLVYQYLAAYFEVGILVGKQFLYKLLIQVGGQVVTSNGLFPASHWGCFTIKWRCVSFPCHKLLFDPVIQETTHNLEICEMEF